MEALHWMISHFTQARVRVSMKEIEEKEKEKEMLFTFSAVYPSKFTFCILYFCLIIPSFSPRPCARLLLLLLPFQTLLYRDTTEQERIITNVSSFPSFFSWDDEKSHSHHYILFLLSSSNSRLLIRFYRPASSVLFSHSISHLIIYHLLRPLLTSSFIFFLFLILLLIFAFHHSIDSSTKGCGSCY